MKYKYCPICTGKLVKKNPTLFLCSSCNFHFYDNPKPTTAVFLEKDKKILLLKRAIKPKKGFWDTPGGFVEKNETIEESAKREVREELGIEIENLKFIGSFTGKYFYQKMIYSTLCFAFKATAKSWKIKLQKEENSEFKFFKKTEIPWKRIAFKDVTLALKKYLSSF